jgi:microcin C transport system substrate-binding protein
MFRFLFTLITVFFLTLSAEKAHGIARFGKPLYPQGFSNFSYVNVNAPKGGTLRLSTIGTFDTANPHAIKGTKAEGVFMLCFDALTYKNPEEPFTLYGLIAESIDVSADNSQVTFELNPNAKFHDGHAITAEDVKFTYEYLREQGAPVYRNYYGKIEKIEILGPLSVRVTLKKEEDGTYNAELPFSISTMRPLPKHILEGKELASFNFDIYVGSGAYKIEKIDQGRSIVYVKVQNYWAENLNVTKGMNNFERIRIDYYKTSQAQFQGFTAGEFDAYFETNPSNWETGYDFPALKNGKVTKVDGTHQKSVMVRSFLYNMKRPIFADWRVRKALAMAFDFDTLNKMIFSSSMQPMDSLFANTYLAHKGAASEIELKTLEDLKEKIPGELYETMTKTGFVPARTKGDGDQRTNLEIAGKLLDGAGWKVVKGMRTNSKGEPLKVELMYKDTKLEKITLALKESLRKLGVELVIRVMDNAQYETRVDDRDFDIIIHACANSLSPGVEQVFYYSQKMADTKGSSNYGSLKDPIAEQLAISLADAKTPEELTERAHTLDRYLMNMYYFIPMFYDNTSRFAYWVNNITFPEINAKIGTNIMAYGWKPEVAAAPTTSCTTDGIFCRIKSFVKSLF